VASRHRLYEALIGTVRKDARRVIADEADMLQRRWQAR